MIKLSSCCLFEISSPSSITLFNKIKQNKLFIKEASKIDTYKYRLSIKYKDKKKFLKLFENAYLVSESGFIPNALKQIKKKTTLFCLIIATLFFFYLSSLLMKIEIVGSSENFDQIIEIYLDENNIKLYKTMPSINKLSKLKDDFFFKNADKLESIEFNSKGSLLSINYVLKKQSVEIKPKKGKMYASKDGVIDYINIISGYVLCKEKQYVHQGDLLVDDCFYFKESSIKVGTQGEIYAYTFETVEIYKDALNDKSETFSLLLDEARRKVSLYFTDKERIDKELVQDFYIKENIAYISIAYTLYENIVIY